MAYATTTKNVYLGGDDAMIVSQFKGMVPRIDRRDSDPSFAIKAHDVNLSRGSLHAWGAPVVKFSGADLKSFYAQGCQYFAWQECVTVAEWLPTSRRLFITGRAKYPEAATYTGNNPLNYFRLGVPAPTTEPQANHPPSLFLGTMSEVRDYVYTYVNVFGEEGSPSFASPIITAYDGEAVTITNLSQPPAEYGVVSIRLYRTSTGHRSAGEAIEKETGRFLVAEIPVTRTQHVDVISSASLGDGLSTENTREPPAGIQQITSIEGTALLCGFHKNTLLFSENREPHNWPLEYETTLDDNIVAIASANAMVYVATSGYPYVIQGQHPCDGAERVVNKYDLPLPMISCSPRGIVATPFGAIYIGAEGLVLLPPQGQAVIITQPLWTTYQWRQLRPAEGILGYYQGQVYFSISDNTFIIPIDKQTYGLDTVYVTTASIRPTQMQTTGTGQLLFLENSEVKQWDAGGWLPYTWRTSTRDVISSITAVRVLFETAGTVDLEVSNKSKRVQTLLHNSKPKRLPRIGRAVEFEIEISGTAEIVEFGYGVSMAETVIAPRS